MMREGKITMNRDSIRRSVRRGSGLLAVAAIAAAALGGCRGGSGAASDPGITDKSITLGFTEPFTGPLAGNGLPLAKGIQAYMASVNASGGINGRQVVLKDYDNGYDPARAVQAARTMVEQDKVFAVFGSIGTPVNLAMRDYLAGQQVPNLFMGTGDEHSLGDGKWATSALAGYADEARVYTQELLKKDPKAKIAVLYQNDDLGQSHLSAVKKTIAGTGAKIVAQQSYAVTDPSVASQMQALAHSGADSLIVIATGQAAIQAFSSLGTMNWHPRYLAANSTASTIPGLKVAGFKNAQGLISTLYIKDPSDPQWSSDPGLARYRAVMTKYAKGADINDYYAAAGYTYAQMVVTALKAMKDPTRAAAMTAALSVPGTSLDMLIPGVVIHTTPEDPHAVSKLQPVVFRSTGWTLDGGPVDLK
jgi:branched-chain amino acid transport system substrate-binding protein